jgi:hypothetical protein
MEKLKEGRVVVRHQREGVAELHTFDIDLL